MQVKVASAVGVIMAIAISAAVGFVVPAQAEPALDGTFPVSGTPGQITPGPDGNVWFTLSGSSANKEFGRITPDGTVTEYDTPNDQSVSGIGVGPNALGEAHSRIWFSQNGAVSKWDPGSESGTSFSVAVLNGPRGITADSDGVIWVVDDQDGLIRINPSDGSVLTEVGVAGSGGRGITLGGDGNLWWADFGQGAINRTLSDAPFSTESFAVGGGPQDVAAGPPQQVGYSNQGAFPHEVGTISSAGDFAAVQVPDTDPFGVAFGSDKAYWFANFFSGDLGRLSTDGAYTRPVEMPLNSGPRYISAGNPGTLWVTLETAGEIARVTGIPIAMPAEPGPAEPGPAKARPKVTRLKVAVRKRRATVRFRLNRAARVRMVVSRKRGVRFRAARKISRKGRPGANAVRVKGLRPGAYRVRVIARADGRNSAPALRAFRVRR